MRAGCPSRSGQSCAGPHRSGGTPSPTTRREGAGRMVQEGRGRGRGDCVADVAGEWPLRAIAELIGTRREDRRKIFEWSTQMIGYDDPEYDVEPMAASAELVGYAWNMAE